MSSQFRLTWIAVAAMLSGNAFALSSDIIPFLPLSGHLFAFFQFLQYVITGTSPGKKRYNLTEAEPGSELEGVSSLNQYFPPGDNVKHELNLVENGVGNNHDCNADHVPGQPFSK